MVDSEIQMFQNALEFSGVKRDVMSPRRDYCCRSLILLKILKNCLSRQAIVVYQNSLDDIIGYVHSFDLFKSQEILKRW
jgi:CBS domain containing-hemolysin-like protein